MSSKGKDAVTKLATTVYKDPTATVREKILARGWLLFIHGKLPA